jgi:hypothetical protein
MCSMFRKVSIQLASDALFPCQQKRKQISTIPIGKKGKCMPKLEIL